MMKAVERRKKRKAKKAMSPHHRRRDDIAEGSVFFIEIIGEILMAFPRLIFYIVAAPFRLIGSLLDGF